MARHLWIDTTLRARAAELLALVPNDHDRALLRRWMDDPKRLSGAELIAVEDSILPALRYLMNGSDEQPRYRWVDAHTGEVDE